MQIKGAYIALFFTGGTIGMDRVPGMEGAAPGGNFERLMAHLAPHPEIAVRPAIWSDMPSPHMTPEHMLRLAMDVNATLADPAALGAVVLHGTDLIAESAFTMELALAGPKPVVFTGSMRHMGEAGYDGVRNVRNAINICLSAPPRAEVLVQLGDWIFSARDAIKEDSLSVDPIASQTRCAAGRLAGDHVVFMRPVTAKRPFLPFPVAGMSKDVHLVAAYPGMGPELIDFLVEKQNAKGVVIEGFGAGNIPPALCPALKRAHDAGAVVVVATRCMRGGVWPLYGYPGGAAFLQKESKAILAHSLNGPKALLLLKAAIAHGCTRDEIIPFFE